MNPLHLLVPGQTVFGLRDSIFNPLQNKNKKSGPLKVLDLPLRTSISLLDMLGLLWHETFRLLKPTAQLSSLIPILQSPSSFSLAS
ncbi:hypothetical protein BGZ60DRAFT_406766 [Tricladium varicosporioides]|nr:hypothetical protein BGZ60DRAFT_406766 [Hymenoscyphus varicosporioides]